jgi:hypothetical protein
MMTYSKRNNDLNSYIFLGVTHGVPAPKIYFNQMLAYIAFFIDSRNHLKGVKGDRGEKGV